MMAKNDDAIGLVNGLIDDLYRMEQRGWDTSKARAYIRSVCLANNVRPGQTKNSRLINQILQRTFVGRVLNDDD